MTESGINSFDEFLLFYLFAGFVVALLWAMLEADVVLGSVTDDRRRRERRLRVTRLLAPLGIAHVAFALVALDAARLPGDDPVDGTTRARHQRAATEAAVSLGLGVVVVLFVMVRAPWG